MTWSIPRSTDPGPVREVREGMHVLDADGQEVGTVVQVQMGDAQAVTGEGQQGSVGMSALLAAAFTAGPTIPEQERERLVRLGYLRLAGGLLSGDRYVTADHVVRVDGDRVQLDVRGPALLEA